MADERTKDQKAADAALDAAITQSAHAYGHTGNGARVVTDWVVLGAGIGMDESGDSTTLGFYLLPDDGQTLDWHRLIGMVRATQLRIERAYLEDGSGD